MISCSSLDGLLTDTSLPRASLKADGLIKDPAQLPTDELSRRLRGSHLLRTLVSKCISIASRFHKDLNIVGSTHGHNPCATESRRLT